MECRPKNSKKLETQNPSSSTDDYKSQSVKDRKILKGPSSKKIYQITNVFFEDGAKLKIPSDIFPTSPFLRKFILLPNKIMRFEKNFI